MGAVAVPQHPVAFEQPLVGVPATGEPHRRRVDNVDASFPQVRGGPFPQGRMGLHPGAEDGCGKPVVAFGNRVEDRLDQPVVRRAVGVAEPLDAQLADAGGQVVAGLVAEAIPAGERIDYHCQVVPLGQQGEDLVRRSHFPFARAGLHHGASFPTAAGPCGGRCCRALRQSRLAKVAVSFASLRADGRSRVFLFGSWPLTLSDPVSCGRDSSPGRRLSMPAVDLAQGELGEARRWRRRAVAAACGLRVPESASPTSSSSCRIVARPHAGAASMAAAFGVDPGAPPWRRSASTRAHRPKRQRGCQEVLRHRSPRSCPAHRGGCPIRKTCATCGGAGMVREAAGGGLRPVRRRRRAAGAGCGPCRDCMALWRDHRNGVPGGDLRREGR